MNKWEYRRRVRHNKMSDDIDKRNRHRCAAAMAVCVLANIAFTICCAQPTASAYAQSADDVAHEVAQAACRTSMQWPLEHAQVIGEYDAPAKQWLPGHRGLDLRARPQDAIIAPADGVVAFSGKVAGKSVVTLRHGAEMGSLTSTFEPRSLRDRSGPSSPRGSVSLVLKVARNIAPMDVCIGASRAEDVIMRIRRAE